MSLAVVTSKHRYRNFDMSHRKVSTSDTSNRKMQDATYVVHVNYLAIHL